MKYARALEGRSKGKMVLLVEEEGFETSLFAKCQDATGVFFLNKNYIDWDSLIESDTPIT